MTPSGAYDLPLIASSYTLAAFAATPFVMVYGMRTGRRLLLLWACALVFVGAIIQAASYGMAQIIVARVLCGFGIGLVRRFCGPKAPHVIDACSPQDLRYRSGIPD
jgi:MFS family permease